MQAAEYELMSLTARVGKLSRTGRHREALDVRRELVERFPRSEAAARAQFEIGLEFLRREDYETALTELSRVGDHSHDHWTGQALCLRAMVQERRGDRPGAEETLRSVVKQHPDTMLASSALAILGTLLSAHGEEERARQVRQESRDLLERLSRDDSSSAGVVRALVALSDSFHGEGQTARARSFLQDAADLAKRDGLEHELRMIQARFRTLDQH